MTVLGKLTTVVMTVAAVAAAIVTVKSIPDIQRYLRIRNM